tara:strand:- start:286 stop:465 length:180 start_codon:yes stop_codon:yes gene_type:complete
MRVILIKAIVMIAISRGMRDNIPIEAETIASRIEDSGVVPVTFIARKVDNSAAMKIERK